MRTTSVVSAFAAAARMICSSWERFTAFVFEENPGAFFLVEDAAERTRLTKSRAPLVFIPKHDENFIERAFQQGLPFLENRKNRRIDRNHLSRKNLPGLVHQMWILPNFDGNQAVPGQGTLVDTLMRLHRTNVLPLPPRLQHHRRRSYRCLLVV